MVRAHRLGGGFVRGAEGGVGAVVVARRRRLAAGVGRAHHPARALFAQHRALGALGTLLPLAAAGHDAALGTEAPEERLAPADWLLAFAAPLAVLARRGLSDRAGLERLRLRLVRAELHRLVTTKPQPHGLVRRLLGREQLCEACRAEGQRFSTLPKLILTKRRNRWKTRRRSVGVGYCKHKMECKFHTPVKFAKYNCRSSFL